MIDPLNPESPSRRAVVVFVGLLLVLAAGALSLDENRERFMGMSAVARRDLAETLRRFDHDFRPEKQKEIRSIDDRIKALPTEERTLYFAASRRFHNWIKSLPERARDDLLAKAPDQRMAAARTLIAKYPLPDLETRSPVDFIETGGTGLFEVASLCKAWLALAPAERSKLDALPPGGRRGALHLLGRGKRIPRELRPSDYDENHWIERVEKRLDEIRGSAPASKDWVARLENRFQAANRKGEGKEVVRPFLHRIAVNLYVQENEAPASVDPSRLTQFFDAIPPWVQSTFNVFPADEARRRLTIVYRLVFPSPQEFDPRAGTAAKADPKAQSATPAARGTPGPVGSKPVPPGPVAPKPPVGSPTPF